MEKTNEELNFDLNRAKGNKYYLQTLKDGRVFLVGQYSGMKEPWKIVKTGGYGPECFKLVESFEELQKADVNICDFPEFFESKQTVFLLKLYVHSLQYYEGMWEAINAKDQLSTDVVLERAVVKCAISCY